MSISKALVLCLLAVTLMASTCNKNKDAAEDAGTTEHHGDAAGEGEVPSEGEDM